MYNGLLGLHSLLRWAILLLLLVVIIRTIVNSEAKYSEPNRKWGLRLLIVTHINLLIGLYQYFFGEKGIALIKEYGMKDVMKTSALRYWAIEHIFGMIVAVALITAGYSISKKPIEAAKKNKKLLVIYVLALVVILAVVPWPFRTGDVGRPWFRGLQ
ncbi:hypothetical protein ACI6Q2_21890 [Chitinophagaceae bacterium LWZ2-11]